MSPWTDQSFVMRVGSSPESRSPFTSDKPGARGFIMLVTEQDNWNFCSFPERQTIRAMKGWLIFDSDWQMSGSTSWLGKLQWILVCWCRGRRNFSNSRDGRGRRRNFLYWLERWRYERFLRERFYSGSRIRIKSEHQIGSDQLPPSYYAPPHSGIKRWCPSDVCLSRTSGLSREQRGLGRLKSAQRQPTSYVTRTPLSRSKVNLQGAWAYCGGLPHSLFGLRLLWYSFRYGQLLGFPRNAMVRLPLDDCCKK